MLISVLSFTVVFTFIALSHEAGHFFFAKLFGVKVFEFGIGFGKRLFSITRGETTYSINLFPVLAFVRIAGEGESDEEKACSPEQLLVNKSTFQRFMIAFAGPMLNLICAVLLLSVLFSFSGMPSGVSNEIGMINKNSPAEKAGLMIGDRLIAINGAKFSSMDKAIAYIHEYKGKSLELSILREKKTITISANPEYNAKLKVHLIGFSPKALYTKVNPLQAIGAAFTQTYVMVAATLQVVIMLFTGAVSISDLAGPVGIAQITGKYAQTGLVSFVFFTAFISVNIGIINLLPLPALDGFSILFRLFEGIFRRKINSELENRINGYGLVFLLGFMFLVTVNDVLRIFTSR